MFKTMKSAAIIAAFGLAQITKAAEEVHGSGAQGTVMGPVAFMWPADRPWSSDTDNIGPCGSSSSITNRTVFPLGTPGSVALTIADEAWQVAFRIAYGNNPTTQDAFDEIVGNISEVDSGHQCYPVTSIPDTVAAGSNATIQLEYWASDSNKNESFFACADITFVRASAFTLQVPCFNVTSSEFVTETQPASTTTASSTAAPQATSSDNATVDNSTSNNGLSAGAKAGISVGAIIGGLALIGAMIFVAMRKRRASKKDAEAATAVDAPMKDTSSFTSGRTTIAN